LAQTYQQPLDILVNAGEQIYFKVSGAYDIHLTGNFVIPENEIMDSDDDEESDDGEGAYNLEDLLDEQGDFSGDDLDDLEDPRVMEVDSEEEAPKLIKSKKEEKKNKKRTADDSDEEISKDAIKKLLKTEDPTENGEKLSKKQKKKLKNNAGEAAEAPKAESKPADKKAAKDTKGEKDNASANASGKKVQFADKLEQGPTPTKADNNKGPKAWTVQGVKIDQRKAGSGPGAKKGDKVGMRYIGKLKDGKQFDGKLFNSSGTTCLKY
jgi:FK506-binding nuclear protein